MNCSHRFRQPGADFVRQPPGQHLIQHDTECINITSRVQFQRIGQHLFRTHIGEGSDDLSQIGLMGHPGVAVGCSRYTEIENFRLAGLIHENVARLKVAVDDPALMRVVNGVADPGHEIQPLASCQLMRIGVLEQRLTADEFHGEIRLWSESGLSGSCFVDLGNPGMLQASERQ